MLHFRPSGSGKGLYWEGNLLASFVRSFRVWRNCRKVHRLELAKQLDYSLDSPRMLE